MKHIYLQLSLRWQATMSENIGHSYLCCSVRERAPALRWSIIEMDLNSYHKFTKKGKINSSELLNMTVTSKIDILECNINANSVFY